jgi:endonuclease YncB( thermonuclease family)
MAGIYYHSGTQVTGVQAMRKNMRKQIRLTEELLDYINDHVDNASQFIREAVRDKVEAAQKLDDNELSFVEIRAKNQYTFSAALKRVIDGDTLELEVDLGFFITVTVKVRLADIDCPPIDTPEGQQAATYIEKALNGANMIIETRKKERYGRYLTYIYYSREHDDFEGIIRHGTMINEELVRNGYADRY